MEIINKIVDNIVLPLVTIIFVLATFLFVWGLFGFFINAEDTEARKKGQNHILYGIIGIAIMVSVYGIVRFVAYSLGQPAPL